MIGRTSRRLASVPESHKKTEKKSRRLPAIRHIFFFPVWGTVSKMRKKGTWDLGY